MNWRSYAVSLLVLVSLTAGFPMGSIRTAIADNIKTARVDPVHFVRVSPGGSDMAQSDRLSPTQSLGYGAFAKLEENPQDFTLLVIPSDLQVCTPADAVYNVEVGQIDGSTDPVTLSASGNPAGTTVGFSISPVIPPGTSTMTIGNTGAAATGSYTIHVSGQDPSPLLVTTSVNLLLFATPPPQTMLISPTNGENNIPVRPNFTWAASRNATSYHFLLAKDILFTDVILDVAGIGETSYTSPVTLDNNTLYYWQVAAQNACGEGTSSEVFHFTTTNQLPRIFLPLVIR